MRGTARHDARGRADDRGDGRGDHGGRGDGHGDHGGGALPVVDIAVPVLNEEKAIVGGVRTLHDFLSASFPLPWRVTIVDNGSTDATWSLARQLAHTLDGVHALRTGTRGKGAAIRAAWHDSPAEIVAFMDIDLSTDLGALLPLVAPLVSGHSDLAIGTRLACGARIHRGFKRETVSRAYQVLLRVAFASRFSDATCGFKAARADIARRLMEKVRDDGWFFDTELLLLAEHNGLRVHEVPVDWVEDAESKVSVARTARHNLRCVMRAARTMSSDQADVDVPERPALAPVHPDVVIRRRPVSLPMKLVPFAVIGLASTALHAALYTAARPWCAPAVANLGALAVCAVANTEANRRWTFRWTPRRSHGALVRAHSKAGGLAFLNYLVTSAAVTVAGWFTGRAGEVTALVVASVTMTVFRFLALDRWVFSVRALRPVRRRAAVATSPRRVGGRGFGRGRGLGRGRAPGRQRTTIQESTEVDCR